MVVTSAYTHTVFDENVREVDQELGSGEFAGGGGGGGTWVNFCWLRAAGLSKPLPHYSLFYGQL